jgi:hypothetical protein
VERDSRVAPGSRATLNQSTYLSNTLTGEVKLNSKNGQVQMSRPAPALKITELGWPQTFHPADLDEL